MQIIKTSGLIVVCACLILLNGCVAEHQYKDLKIQNATQRKHIATLESELQTTTLMLDKLKRELADSQTRGGTELDAIMQKITALEEDIAKKKALIGKMQQQLLYGGARLPAELSTLLEDFAKGNEMITYDASRGIVKFKSDLLFEKGSDIVTTAAADAVKSLCQILTSDQAKEFDIIIAGHTDDIPIRKPQTKAKHPTNWHLSADRAVSVLQVMAANNIVPQRLSVRGFGEYRAVEDNKPGKKGNPKNRRVEIFIVAKGV